jgi:hypothetical protein
LQATNRVAELEREKAQDLAAWEKCRSEFLTETTELQEKLRAFAAIEQSAASQRIAWKAHVNALGDAVDTCRGDCECVVLAITKKSQTLLEALNQKYREFTRLKDEMAAFAREAVEVCGQGVADIGPFLPHVEELVQKVRFDFCC